MTCRTQRRSDELRQCVGEEGGRFASENVDHLASELKRYRRLERRPATRRLSQYEAKVYVYQVSLPV
eukprot:CAMPEP_0181182542 /NCGR_PEP_ID=MMETSP1096-20121128/7946_1 /TAXON_ID=156174 ORGANISM="Chrysochromulina ericina, Strain CCMP281" /NCGR_SAMPLE_ID=MMETSP1096 /ASSEMBLY_ACC=CAM_ASM_000453 /LENGTH=66 /DNA_ID=CAMNT_0023271159 /DNA_START=404 /DNA_END=604 /DNA_ORIENTATION=-